MLRKTKPSLLVMGRVGVHAARGLDIGSNTENCARSAKCNIKIAGREAHPPAAEQKKGDIPWSIEAEQLIGKIPQMARGWSGGWWKILPRRTATPRSLLKSC